jgi:hypothetical protein
MLTLSHRSPARRAIPWRTFVQPFATCIRSQHWRVQLLGWTLIGNYVRKLDRSGSNRCCEIRFAPPISD